MTKLSRSKPVVFLRSRYTYGVMWRLFLVLQMTGICVFILMCATEEWSIEELFSTHYWGIGIRFWENLTAASVLVAPLLLTRAIDWIAAGCELDTKS